MMRLLCQKGINVLESVIDIIILFHSIQNNIEWTLFWAGIVRTVSAISTMIWVAKPANQETVVQLCDTSPCNQKPIFVFPVGCRALRVPNWTVCKRVQWDHVTLLHLVGIFALLHCKRNERPVKLPKKFNLKINWMKRKEMHVPALRMGLKI